MAHRGPDQNDIFNFDGVFLGHNRLAILDLENGVQPMTRIYNNKIYTIVYNGEIYNMPELLIELKNRGVVPQSSCDTEIVLYSYILWGERCAELLNGIFAFAVFDEDANRVFFARDRFGVKPLFYSIMKNEIIFASEIKSLLKHPKIKPTIDKIGLWQLLFLSPMKLSGSGVFKDINEILPAHYAWFDENGFVEKPYWELKAQEFKGDAFEAIEYTGGLLEDAIRRQLVSDVPLCTFLSGGLDSSIITAVASREYAEKGDRLSTYSFEYPDNKINFKSSIFQPHPDDDYAKFLADYLDTDHTILDASTNTLIDNLYNATKARDLPGMADIDSSLLYYCSEVKKRHTVALSGECADEIFGGYPWFYRPEMLKNEFYPWIHNPFARVNLFRDDKILPNEGYRYLCDLYQKDIESYSKLESDSVIMNDSRKATYLSTKYFMSSLLERKDRMSMASGVEVRVPFADHRIIEYIYNVPWEIKFEGGVEKALLRNAMKSWLPDKILNRKKSPYPKTHDPMYEKGVIKLLTDRLNNKSSPIKEILDKQKFLDSLSNGNETFYGQLMSRPQLLAWILQLEYWLREYNIELSL